MENDLVRTEVSEYVSGDIRVMSLDDNSPLYSVNANPYEKETGGSGVTRWRVS